MEFNDEERKNIYDDLDELIQNDLMQDQLLDSPTKKKVAFDHNSGDKIKMNLDLGKLKDVIEPSNEAETTTAKKKRKKNKKKNKKGNADGNNLTIPPGSMFNIDDFEQKED